MLIGRLGFLNGRTLYLQTMSLVLVLAMLACQPTTAQSSPDPLPSWNDGASKKAILDFVRETTTANSAEFVPADQRIATFDNDGTLWVEQPLYTEFVFSAERAKAEVEKHPEWKNKEPFVTAVSGDLSALAKLTMPEVEEIAVTAHSGMSVEEFQSIVKQWIATAVHPRFKKHYPQLVYQPMLEVIQYLRSSGYKVYIVTGGGQDFVRAFAEQNYGVPPENVVGTAGETEYTYAADGTSKLIKLPKILFVDDKAGKAKSINLMIGRRPYAAFGNSTGDQEMLEWTQSGKGKRLMMLVHHDDAQREYAYGADSKIGTFSDALMGEAKKRGWLVISIKNDWKTVFK